MDQQQIMEILAKILESQNELRKNQEATNQEMNAMRQDFNTKQDAMSKKLAKIELSIEHDISVKISTLYDSREVQKDHNVRVDETLDRIEKKVEVLQLETSSLRRIK